jgi:hypothetical protein
VGGAPAAPETAPYGRGGGVGSVGVGGGVGVGGALGIGSVGVTGTVGVGTGSVGSTPDPVGVGPLPDALGLVPPDGVGPGRGREWPALAWSCDASFVIAGDSGASVCGLSAR